MSDTSAKQKIIDKVKDSTNILVTVSTSPSVDELSAALGISLLLNKMKKHATAVFSGDIPPAINFLDPEKTFENTVNSLRDFIIALDKEKADHLRYKVEGDVVKIFITPYRTTITSEDLDFSQGDYNVEMVLALGVKSQGNLDKALGAHGRILDDATVATIMAGSDKSDLGSISWHDGSASSLSEMMVSLSEGLKGEKTLIDEQIATAFLAGIVSATERFSNNRTSAKVMNMSAQLMSQGANQQLIASKFEETEEGPVQPGGKKNISNRTSKGSSGGSKKLKPKNSDGTTSLSEGESNKLDRSSEKKSPQTDGASEGAQSSDGSDGGTLRISHEKEGNLDEVTQQTMFEGQSEATEAARTKLDFHTANTATAETIGNPAEAEELATPAIGHQELLDQLPEVSPQVQPGLSPEDINADIAAANAEVESAASEVPQQAEQPQAVVSNEAWRKAEEPAYGGTLNATTHTAAEESRKAEMGDRNKTILSHNTGYIADEIPPRYTSPLNAMANPPEDQTMVNFLNEPAQGVDSGINNNPPGALQPKGGQIISPPPLPPLPDFSTLPPLPPNPEATDTSVASGDVMGSPPPDRLGDILPPPDQSAAPPLAVTDDPGQFRIPGQS